MQRLGPLYFAIVVSLLIVIAGLLHALKQHPPYAPQINAEQQAKSALKGEEHAKASEPNAAKTNEVHGGKNVEQREEEGTEFWPLFFGLRLKITDSLLAAFTFGLLVFTGLLWRSTDKLWAASERQLDVISKQLGISVISATKAERGLLVDDDWQIVRFGPCERPILSCVLRNTGRSPNYITQGVYDYAVATALPAVFDIVDKPITALPGIVRQTSGNVIVIFDLPELSAASYYDQLALGTTSLYLRIRIRYRDVMGAQYEIAATAKYGMTVGRNGERLFGFEFPEEQRPEDSWPTNAAKFANSRRYNNHRAIDDQKG